MPNIHNLNEALAELGKLAIKTEHGVFFRAEDVERLLGQQGVEEAQEEEKVLPKTMTEARAAVMGNKDLMTRFSTPEAQQSALRAVVSS